MKPEQIYQELKDLAEKLGILVEEQNLRKTGIHVNSGLCKVKDKDIFIMDKHENIHEKNKILASCLSELAIEEIYVVPAVRDYINEQKKRSPTAKRRR